MAATNQPVAHGYAWRRHIAALMPALRSRADDCCELCHRPIDFDAPARTSQAPSVDHIVPLSHGGAELPPIDELRLAHVGCNSGRGNKTRVRAPLVRPTAAVELRDADEPRARAYAPTRRRRQVEHVIDDQARLFELDDDERDESVREFLSAAPQQQYVV